MARLSRSLAALLSIVALSTGSLLVGPAPALAATSVPHFLTLPFKVTKRMHIQQGNIWQGPPYPAGHVHGGIDYINGRLDRSATWRTFPVYAAAPGYACAALDGRKGCIPGTGNRVMVTTMVRGKPYRTYYGHVQAISKRIPIGTKTTVFVRRGELLGYAGYSGDPCCVRHLHFQLMDPRWKTVDPYGIDGVRGEYPDPQGTNGIPNGRRSYWRDDPPEMPAAFISRPVERIPYDTPKSGRTPAATPRATAAPRRTARPERTPRPTQRPQRTPRPSPSPPPSDAPGLRPSPSLVAAVTRSLQWWARVLTEMWRSFRVP